MTDLFPDLQPDQGPCQGLWDATRHARTNDPATSQEAAEEAPGLASRHMKIILGALRRNPGGLTSQEVEETLSASQEPLTHAQVWRRMSDLRVRGEVEDSGLRRKTTSNRPSIVWRCRW